MYADDADLILNNLEEEESTLTAHTALQQSIDSWSRLLVATGGLLKPEKDLHYIIGFKRDNKGEWEYSQTHTNRGILIIVFLPDDS